MRSDLFDEMYQLEAEYWWHVVKRFLVIALLKKYKSFPKKKYKHLDIGCGTGKMLQEMEPLSVSMGIDLSVKALKYCLQRKQKRLVAADLSIKLPIKSNSFDIITMLDVLEHIENDKDILKEVQRILKPEGIFVVTVPSFPFLWTYWDDMLGHKRRYLKKELVEKINNSDMKIIKISYFYSFLFPIAILFRLAKSLLGAKAKTNSDFIKLPLPINKLLIFISRIESQVTLINSIPIGLSLVCACTKQKN